MKMPDGDHNIISIEQHDSDIKEIDEDDEKLDIQVDTSATSYPVLPLPAYSTIWIMIILVK